MRKPQSLRALRMMFMSWGGLVSEAGGGWEGRCKHLQSVTLVWRQWRVGAMRAMSKGAEEPQPQARQRTEQLQRHPQRHPTVHQQMHRAALRLRGLHLCSPAAFTPRAL